VRETRKRHGGPGARKVECPLFCPAAFTEDFEFVCCATEPRNFIAHGGGVISPRDNAKKARRARAFIDRKLGMSLDEHGSIWIDEHFCKRLVDRMDKAMHQLFSALQEVWT